MAETRTLSLKEYDRKKFNVLLPSTEIATENDWHKMRVSEVEISTELRAGDTYPAIGGGEEDESGNKSSSGELRALAKPALNRIGNAAGIIWDPNRSKLVNVDRDYACYQSVGGMRGPDGTLRVATALKEIDIRVVEAKIRMSKQSIGAKKRWTADFIEQMVQRDLIQWRQNKAMRAETGANLRVIRQLLAMRSAYTIEELQRPFIVPRFDINYDDPNVRRMFIQQAALAQTALFGRQAGDRFFHGEEVIELQAPAQIEDEDDFPGVPPAGFTPTTTDAPSGSELPFDACKGCGQVNLPEAVVAYSAKNFGKALCRECQKGAQRVG
jgi:hypothetical protein